MCAGGKKLEGDRLCSWRSPVTGGGAIRHDRICVVRALTPSAPPGESHFKSLEAPPLLGVSEPAPANHYKDVTSYGQRRHDELDLFLLIFKIKFFSYPTSTSTSTKARVEIIQVLKVELDKTYPPDFC